ncbi:MAG: energy transducer TonB, partial [Winogradskyella sp.]
NTSDSLSASEKKEYFSNKIKEIVTKNFRITQSNLGLKGRQRIFTQFTIDKNGLINDIKISAQHSVLEKEAIRVIKLLPQFNPAKQEGKTIDVTYTLPIAFIIRH